MGDKGRDTTVACGKAFRGGEIYECYMGEIWIDLCEGCLQKLGLIW